MIHNALVVYMQNNQYDKALPLLESERKNGLLTEEKDYVESARFYANIAQGGDKPEVAVNGAELLQEGMTKNIVKPTVENYKLQGDLYMIAQKNDKALVSYGKASPLASNGDIDYTRAQIIGAEQNWAEAKIDGRESHPARRDQERQGVSAARKTQRRAEGYGGARRPLSSRRNPIRIRRRRRPNSCND